MKIEKIELPEELKEQLEKFIERHGICDCKNCEVPECKNRKEPLVKKEEQKTEPKKAPEEKINWVVPRVFARTLTKEEDEAEGIELTVELPGIDEEDLSLKVVDRCVVIEAKGNYKNYKFHSSPLPKEIDEESADGSFIDGLLIVSIFKKEVESFDIPVNE